MVEFREITLQDKELLERYTLGSSIRNCDLSFANIYCWQPTYKSAWAIIDEFLVIRFNIDGGCKLGYMQPIGIDGSLEFAKIIPQLAQDAHANNDRLRIIGITNEGYNSLKNCYNGDFAMHSDPNFEDYIYSREALCTLAGKKLQPKRNHINQFLKQYGDRYEYRPLTPDLFDDCLELDCAWRRAHNDCCNRRSPERNALERALENFDKLELKGGALLVDGKLAAFTYGSQINSDTFCIHVEKASLDYNGSYTIINRLFAETIPENFTLINREEDLGIEGLRRAKVSYYPTAKTEKYTAIYLHHDEKECKRLWKEVFKDDDIFIDEFMMHHYSNSNMLRVTDNENRYVSMLHIVDFACEGVGKVAYIYGVATKESHRGKGYATKLMTAVMEKIKSKSYDAAMLIPAANEPHLKEFYAKFGLKLHPSTTLSFQSYNNFDFADNDSTTPMVWKKEEDSELPSQLILTK
ncbi:MAG: GNAT family N-acetyltransferase [Rikenellaceae bacterium]